MRWRWKGSYILFFVWLLVLWLVQPGIAQSSKPLQEEERRSFGGPDSVQSRIESDSLEVGVFELKFLKPYYNWKDRIREKYGYSFGLVYVPVFLKADRSLSGTDKHASSGVFRFLGFWQLFGRGSETTGTLTYLVEHRHRYTFTSPALFSLDNLGNVGAISIPFADDGWHLTNLYWSQKWKNGRYEVVVGFLDVTDFVDVYPLTSPWTDFYNFVFSIGVATMDLPDDGALGLAAGAWLTDRIYIIGGFEDLNSDPNQPFRGFDTFFTDAEFFKHIEIGYTTSPKEKYYLNNLHLTLWHADKREKAGIARGYGAVLSFTHSIGDKWLVFARGGYAKEGGNLLQKSVSVGGAYQPYPIAIGDVPGSQLGFGFNWGQPNRAVFGKGLRDQYTLEAYFRLQVTREFAITPDLQLLINPALNPEKSAIWVFGLRGRLAF